MQKYKGGEGVPGAILAIVRFGVAAMGAVAFKDDDVLSAVESPTPPNTSWPGSTHQKPSSPLEENPTSYEAFWTFFNKQRQ